MENEVKNEVKNEIRSDLNKVMNNTEPDKTEPGIENKNNKNNAEKAGDIIIEGIDIIRTFKMGEVLVRALRGVNVKIRRGEFVAIMGPAAPEKHSLKPAGTS
jgi:putative ABC transport system ATP-binding protein